MRQTKESIFLKIAILSGALFYGCASGGPSPSAGAYKESRIFIIPIGKAVRAKEKIDDYEAYQIYFKLGKAVDSVRISISSEFIADILGTKKALETYFIVEKTIPAEGYKNIKAPYFYAEIGKNFDVSDWTREKELTIISEKGSPFKSLESGPAYRIRFTSFSTESLDFKIKIEADCDVTFMDAIE